jgi:predicted RNA binding protein YcfA (HicA-like mRNA interferase family)
MPKLGPVKQKDFPKYLRKLGFDGPFAGGNHSFMKRGPLKIRVPSTDIGKGLLRRILRQAGISETEWESLG